MDQKCYLLTNLPSEIIINILSELPLRTIISCKCVCKSLFQIIETPDFSKFHLSKSIPGLIVCIDRILRKSFEILEIKDELGLQKHKPQYVPVAIFKRIPFVTHPPSDITMEGSANGLLLINKIITNALYVCNPVTREYINLPTPKAVSDYHMAVVYGFGISKKTEQYTVVRISHKCERDQDTNSLLSISEPECHVYTLGTRTWRSVPHYSSLAYKDRSNGAFMNGNLHWLVSDLKESMYISCFDIETDLFELFFLPHSLPKSRTFLGHVAVLGDHLCFCDDTSGNEIVIWIMKEYGVEKSWTKEFVIKTTFSNIYPIKVYRNGDILLLWRRIVDYLVYYSDKTKTIRHVDVSRTGDGPARHHVSSFLSLKSFEMENVAKF